MSTSDSANRIPAQLEPEMTPAVKAFVLELFARLDKLKEQVRKLTPRNSSVLPSTKHPHARPERNTRKSGRKQGGQKGHKRNVRPLIPTEDCSQLIPCIPEQCRRYGDVLALSPRLSLRSNSSPVRRSNARDWARLAPHHSLRLLWKIWFATTP